MDDVVVLRGERNRTHDWAEDLLADRSAEVSGPISVSGSSPGRPDERHSINEASAFEMLREHSRTTNRKLVASAVVEGHRLLPRQPEAPSQSDVLSA